MSTLLQQPQQSSASSKRERLKICHVSMTLQTGGLEKLLVELARHSNSDEAEMHFLCLEEAGVPAEELQAMGCEVTSLELKKLGKLRLLKALYRHFAQHQFDVVHTHNTYPGFYAALPARMAGVPAIINTQHGRGCGPNWKAHWQFRIANQFTHSILGVSDDATELCRKQDPFHKSKIETLWNGIDVDRFAYHGPQNSAHAISVARLSKEKDFPTLLNALPAVLKQHPDFRLTIVGDGAERKALEELTASLQLTDCVTFLGERHDVPDLLKQAGFFVSSSSTEGISLTLLEAMAVGLPIVTTAVGGNPEIVQDRETGHLVPAGNPEALAQAIISHLNNRDMWSAMGELARQRVEKHFSIKRMVSDYMALYRSHVHEQMFKV